ncbi:thiamine-phosphate kinase [Candidatus Omnitrophota bacterium]
MLKQIGEFGLIARLNKSVATDKSVIRGIGDDCAVIAHTPDKYLLFTTDMLVEGVHFSQRAATFTQIGRKALAVNISDIAAMGGIPKYAVISLALPKRISVRRAENIFRGINTLADQFGINIVGGDTVRSNKIVISIAMIGEVKKRDLTLRSGAQIGDLIFVTGHLGGSRRLRQFNFIPRIEEAQKLVKGFKPRAMIDLSDGLAADLKRIAKASQVGALIFAELIPLSRGCSLNSALFDGEDFELLFTLSLDAARKFYRKKIKFPVSCIGKIVQRKRGLAIIDKKSKLRPLPDKSFKHF